jgi:hypothetical protein
MEETSIKRTGGFKLLFLKMGLGALAAVVGMLLMRLIGGGEIVVAVLIGLVAGLAERSRNKALAGVVLGVVGYMVGAQVGAAVAASGQGVPFGHWAVTGAFIGLASGMSRIKDGLFPARPLALIAGAICGLILGAILGFTGDIAGLAAVFTISDLPSFIYMNTTEISLFMAGIFINLGAGLASGLTGRLENKA